MILLFMLKVEHIATTKDGQPNKGRVEGSDVIRLSSFQNPSLLKTQESELQKLEKLLHNRLSQAEREHTGR